MSDDNPWCTDLGNSAPGIRQVPPSTFITDDQRQEGSRRAAGTIERLMRKDGDE